MDHLSHQCLRIALQPSVPPQVCFTASLAFVLRKKSLQSNQHFFTLFSSISHARCVFSAAETLFKLSHTNEVTISHIYHALHSCSRSKQTLRDPPCPVFVNGSSAPHERPHHPCAGRVEARACVRHLVLRCHQGHHVLRLLVLPLPNLPHHAAGVLSSLLCMHCSSRFLEPPFFSSAPLLHLCVLLRLAAHPSSRFPSFPRHLVATRGEERHVPLSPSRPIREIPNRRIILVKSLG
jgi:hypothetical protein